MAERRPLLLRLAAVAIVVVAVSGLGTGRARAHTDLVGSEPRDGQTLTAPPRQIGLTFTEAIVAGSAQVSVRGADGRSVTAGAPTVAETLVGQPVDPEAGGPYLVAYRVVSADGHPVTGEFTFTYAPAAASGAAGATSSAPVPAAAAPAADDAATAEARVSPALWWALGSSVAVLALLATAFLVALRRRGADG